MAYLFNPFTGNFDAVDQGGIYWKSPVANAAALPVSATDGEARVTLDTHDIWIYSALASAWLLGTGVTVGNFNNTSTAKGLDVTDASVLSLHAADATNPGGVSTGTQTFAGAKTFNGALTLASTLTMSLLNSAGVVHTDGFGTFSTSLLVNADVSASAAIAYSKLALSNSIVNADINSSAAIAYSKLALSNSIVNADINASAAIAYSKLALTGSIVNADISASAAVARSKLAAGTAGAVLYNDVSGLVSEDNTNFHWDATNKRLGIGSTSPQGFVHVKGVQTAYSLLLEGNSGTANRNYGVKILDADYFLLERTNSSLTAFSITSSDGVGIRSSCPSGYAFFASAALVGDVAILARNSSGNSGNLQEWQTADSTPVAKVDGTGNATFASTTHSNTTASTVPYLDSGKKIVSSAVTPTELSYVSGVTSAIQTQLNNKLGRSAGDIDETSFSAANNQVAAANVTGLAFANATVRAATIQLSVYVNATSSLYEYYTLNVIQKGAGWDIAATSVGDVSGFTFSITSAGQVQYTNSNYTGFSAATLKFRALTTSV